MACETHAAVLLHLFVVASAAGSADRDAVDPRVRGAFFRRVD